MRQVRVNRRPADPKSMLLIPDTPPWFGAIEAKNAVIIRIYLFRVSLA